MEIEGEITMNWQHFQQQAKESQQQMNRFDKLSNKQQLLEKQLDVTEKLVSQYEKELQASAQQLKKLEQSSFINFIREMSGRRERLYDKNFHKHAADEAKFLEAKLTKNDLLKELDEIKAEYASMNREVSEQQLKSARLKMREWLNEHAPVYAQQLDSLYEQFAYTQTITKEIEEAKVAGENVLKKIKEALDALQSAENYSGFDLFFDTGFIGAALKHEEINKSKNHIHDVQMALQKFHNELLDVEQIKADDINIEIDLFVMFADYVIDDIFSDWSIHSKITTATEKMEQVKVQVKETLQSLEQKHALTIAKQEEIEIARQQIYNKREEILFL